MGRLAKVGLGGALALASALQACQTTQTGDTTEMPPGTCCGCLCADPQWSCSADTCVTERGLAVDLAPEAGMFEIAGGPYEVDGHRLLAPRSRIFYSFHPAKDEPQERPVLVFFNGGPGASTGVLLGYNTGPVTIDPTREQEGTAANRASWAEFGNLLYIDAPNTGFSYSLPLADGERPTVAIDPDRDAATVVRTLVRFLGRHPQLQDNRVILVGESYGGVRATLMLRQLLEYESLATGPGYVDEALQEEITEHFATVFPGTDGVGLPPEIIAEQFFGQVLIQPLIAGTQQIAEPTGPFGPRCIPGGDDYQCDKPPGWTFSRIYEVARRLSQVQPLTSVLGVDPLTIEWLGADARVGAYGRSPGPQETELADQSELLAALGALEPGDRYYIGYNTQVAPSRMFARSSHDPLVGREFLRNVSVVRTLITDAALDTVIWSPAIVSTLATYDELVRQVSVSTTGVTRIRLTYADPSLSETAEIRFPHYPDAGHIVTLGSPAALLDDVTSWFSQP